MLSCYKGAYVPYRRVGIAAMLIFALVEIISALILNIPENISAQKNSGEDFLPYKNAIQKITIQYPSNWTKTDTENIGGNPIVKFSPPQDGFSKVFIESSRLNFGNISLSKYADQQITRLSHLLLKFQPIEKSPLIIGGQNAEKLVYTFILQNVLFKQMEIWTESDTRLYTINYVAEEPKYQVYLPLADKMIKSFQTKNSN
jgi:photosystem II reaction center protein PsbP